MDDKLVLVTGATGYIGGLLIPQLLERGYRVRALARDPMRLRSRAWYSQVEVIDGDALQSFSLFQALEGVHTAYYLIHSMSIGNGYTEREIQAAQNFVNAAEQANVQHIIYLGGLAKPQNTGSRHMASRILTGATLRKGRVPVTEFRAGVIVGPGSISFEMIRYIAEWFPVIVGPFWLRNKVQPIAAWNVLDYLLAALEHPPTPRAVYEIGGPDVMPYGETMLRYARIRGLKRTLLHLPGIPIQVLALFMGWLSPVPGKIARPLIGGLAGDSVVIRDRVRRVFPDVNLLSFDEAVSRSLRELHPKYLERVWDAREETVTILKHQGFFVDHRWLPVNVAPEKVFRLFTQMGGEYGWPFADWLWKLRGWIDKLFGGPGLRSFIEPLREGDAVDYYRVESLEPNCMLRLYSELKAPGQGWMEWRVESAGGITKLSQTGFFAPRGLPGFIYWYALGPVHKFVFRGLIKELARKSEEASNCA
jgi:uncharacterized protein YbjT (DUF2867 family)